MLTVTFHLSIKKLGYIETRCIRNHTMLCKHTNNNNTALSFLQFILDETEWKNRGINIKY